MGNNLDKYLKDPSIAKLKPQFSKLELYMLALLFKDLSSRHHGVIDKETFLQFFPLTGLWGERLFDKFDLKHTGHIDFYEFVKGIATCCHSTEDDKIQLLFSLYDMDQDGFIKKKEMITMLYNYPKDHIKFITDDIAPDKGEKLENLSEVIRRSLHDLDADPFENNIAPVDNARRFSVNSDHVDAALNDELEVAEEEKTGDKFLPLERTITQQSFAMYAQKELEEIKQKDAQNKSATLQEPTDGQPTKLPSKATNNEPNETVPQKRKNSSVSTLITDPSFLIATTVNSRVREYASFMFKNFEGANSRGKISYDEFKQWLTMHPSILKVFDDTFHQEIWSTEHFGQDYYKDHSPDYDDQLKAKQSLKTPEGKVLVFKEREPEHCGYLHKKAKKQTKTLNKRYVELRDHFLIYYSKKEDNYPKGIIFLDGCYIEETTDYQIFHKYGFSITHKSESYEPYYFYCSDKNEFDEWMKHLKLFHSSSIMDIYDFREKIGKGKFSVVFKAITKDAQKNEYAVKVIDKKPLKPEEKEFLLSETSVMKVLDHPNIIKLIDTIETRTNIYIVTELVRDGDLFDYIITRGYLEEYTASFIMKQLLTSVYYIHSISIAHRDIKPENIMISLSSNGEVKEIKIIDFGFAKIINGDAKLLETCGTPNYVAPEVLRGCGYDKQADVWSLGVIMYFMLRGYLPFDAHQVNTILKNTLKGDVPLNDDHWAKISPEGKDLLMKFLCKDPHSRIEIRDALKHPWIKDREHLKQYIGVNRHPENENSEQENA